MMETGTEVLPEDMHSLDKAVCQVLEDKELELEPVMEEEFR